MHVIKHHPNALLKKVADHSFNALALKRNNTVILFFAN